MSTQIAAVVGATGGAGTTRLTLEAGTLLAGTGRDVAIFDAAFQTQGLASYADRPVETDVTALLTDGATLETALVDQPLDLPGTLALCPASAPFERLARAKTAGAAERFEEQLAAATLSHDVVLVDTPPIGGNQAIAAVNAADSIAIVTPDSVRGGDALALTRERLADVGETADATVANWSDGSVIEADAAVPTIETTDPRECPTVLPPDDRFTPAIVDVLAATLGITPDVEIPDSGRFTEILG